MKRSVSLEKVNGIEVVSNARNSCTPDISTQRKRFRSSGSILEQYCITIKPKLYRSRTISDLSSVSDFDYFQNRLLRETRRTESLYKSAGESVTISCCKHPKILMSWNFTGKKPKKASHMYPESYATKFAEEYLNTYQSKPGDNDPTASSCVEDSSMDSIDRLEGQVGAAFPFKSTPSGNLKVQSNQVVFQSSTVGVLLADPTRAEVKVKFEPTTSSIEDDTSPNDNEDSEGRSKKQACKTGFVSDRNAKKMTGVKEEQAKNLESLGYGAAEPIDWMRMQLPKKMDLFQEFYRRIHNYVNTDTIVHIGDEEFHCHYIVLQVYSTFFDMNQRRDIELPISSVTPEAFQTVYEWMIFNGVESNKLLKRDNVLDIFCAAQYLSIKDLENQCWSFIVSENLFTEDTAFILYRKARKKGMAPVMDIMVPRVMRFFLPLVASIDFLGLELEEVITFLKSNYISVTSEIEVLMAGIRWLHGDWSSRRQHAVEVMRCVRFGLISPWQLVDIKRNPDNAEILEIVNEPDVQQMVDDGLAYVIIKYWYGNNSKNYYHWIDVLGLIEPAERNWIGEEKNHVTYKEFLKYLEQFMVPRDQMYQQMSLMQPPRTREDMQGNLRGMDADKMDMRRPKMDFPLPGTLRGLTGDKDKPFPTMNDFFDSQRMAQEQQQTGCSNRTSPIAEKQTVSQPEGKKSPEAALKFQQMQYNEPHNVSQKLKESPQQQRRVEIQHIHLCTAYNGHEAQNKLFDPPEKDSADDLQTTSTVSSDTLDTNMTEKNRNSEKRHSIAASYLAAATAALSGTRRPSSVPQNLPQEQIPSRSDQSSRPTCPTKNNSNSPQISLFNQSKELLAKNNMNKLSTSILGPTNKNYISDRSLFNWDRETVLVFGGIDSNSIYGSGANNGKNIYRFDPVANVWEYVDDLPEPRHHHSIAFLRGRVYLVGGADPRDDDIRGRSVVVSTVWSYEPVTRSWYSESGLLTPRKNFALVVHRMAMYAIGGQDRKGRVLRSVERFDPKTGIWSEMRPMSIARMAMACAKYREYIWVAGGMTGDKKKPVSKIVECYNSKTNEWTKIHNLRFPRCLSTMFAMNDKLYLVGGAGKITEKEKTVSSVGAVDVWNWTEREWVQETEMSMPRHGHALAYLGTQLIIIGGMTTIYMRPLNNVESFCCERGAWIRGVAMLPMPLSGHAAVTLPPASLM